MRVTILRHGDAGETIEDDSALDAKRPLTDEGVAASKAAAEWLRQNGEEPTLVYAAPEARTTQTADIVRRTFKLPPVKIEPGLNDDAAHSLAVVVRKLAGRGEKRVVLVSHHAAIHTGLESLNDMSPHEIEPFAKGEARILDVDRKTGSWELVDKVMPSDFGLPDRF